MDSSFVSNDEFDALKTSEFKFAKKIKSIPFNGTTYILKGYKTENTKDCVKLFFKALGIMLGTFFIAFAFASLRREIIANLAGKKIKAIYVKMSNPTIKKTDDVGTAQIQTEKEEKPQAPKIKDPEEYNTLLQAVKNGDQTKVKQLAPSKVIINLIYPKHKSLLTHAVKAKDKSMVTLLLSLGAEIDKPDGKDRTALTLAAQLKDRVMVDHLLEKGATLDVEKADEALKEMLNVTLSSEKPKPPKPPEKPKVDINALGESGLTPLMEAVMAKDQNKVRDLVGAGAKINLLFLGVKSPLTLAVTKRDKLMIELLASLGAEIDKPDGENQTALALAAQLKFPDIAEYLLYRGARLDLENCDESIKYLFKFDEPKRPDPQKPKRDVNELDQDDLTPLMRAVKFRDQQKVMDLFEENADINLIFYEKKSPLTIAVAASDTSMVDLLLALGANIDKPDGKDLKPLEVAARRGDREMVEHLLKNGAHIDPEKDHNLLHLISDEEIIRPNQEPKKPLEPKVVLIDEFNALGEDGNSPIMRAIIDNDLGKIRTLVGQGADPNLIYFEKRSALTLAVVMERKDIVTLLIELGADINKSDGASEQTPLTLAVKNRSEEMVEHLLTHQANVNQLDATGSSGIHEACKIGNHNLIKILAMNGGDINIVDQVGYTPLGYAQANGYGDLALFLINTMNADIEVTSEFLQRKFIAHLWGIEGTSEFKRKDGSKGEFDLLGYSSTVSLTKMRECLDAYFGIEENAREFTPEEIQLIKSAYKDAYPNTTFTNEQILAKIKTGKPVVVMVSTSGHAIGVVFHNNKLFICNRGEGKKENSIEVFELLAEQVTKKMLDDFIKIHKSTAAFNKMVDDLRLKKVEGIDQKGQKWGNCTWANCKSPLLAILYDLKPNYKYKEYKKFTRFSRPHFYKEYLANSKNPDEPLKRRIVAKAQRKRIVL